MQTPDQVAGEAREKLADRLSDAIGHYGKEITTAWDWNPSAIKDLRVEISYADAKDILAALRAQPERGAEEMKLRAEIACRDLVDHYRETAEAHLSARNASKAEQAIAWADGAMACGKAIRALPLHPAKDEGGEHGSR